MVTAARGEAAETTAEDDDEVPEEQVLGQRVSEDFEETPSREAFGPGWRLGGGTGGVGHNQRVRSESDPAFSGGLEGGALGLVAPP